KLALELLMHLGAARYQRTGAGSKSLLLGCSRDSASQTWICGQAEIVIRSKVDQHLAVNVQQGLLRSSMRRWMPAQPLRFELIELIGDPGQWIEWRRVHTRTTVRSCRINGVLSTVWREISFCQPTPQSWQAAWLFSARPRPASICRRPVARPTSARFRIRQA